MSQRLLRTSPSRPPGRRRTSRAVAGVLAAVVAGAVLAAGVSPAAADPENPTDGELVDAATQQQAAAAEVGRIAALVADAESRLEQVQVQAEAAGTAYLAAEEERQLAEEAAVRAAAELQVAVEAVAASQLRIADFSRDSYMNGSTLTSEMALLDVEGPGELVQKAALLEYVADHQVDVLGQLEGAQARQADADDVARTARDEKSAAEGRAQAAKEAAEAQVAAQQAAYQQVSAQKADLDRQLQDAQVHLLELQGARNAYEQWLAQKRAAEEAAAAAQRKAAAEAAAAAQAARRGGGGTAATSSAGYIRPASGSTSSCFGSRWGVTHFGVDIAAPIGTPIYAATAGTVQRAGPATGFGLAVYIRGDDGAVTVYGHVNEYYVRAGERVRAGAQIAEVGNRGQSTGPHLHFEVHPRGTMYSGQVDPVPWMRARGVSINGCG
ncbi:Murein DD-endopeptidase MepM and murein hydrolase activator NlpD, contain LysM domain [Modestobacter sp. DSM 44400]|uniref:M23 family metallopeptidase n=1 Tax=Modestobacter sp. DSM 44400 TaxID=1550230 RepID=UPI000894F337|nr:M23 family metallopeptidase [Modestobacter sp. DSM 44400]SDY49296.1 Murein DD-endopeptidase MepM and murein hydrolase activator NlpD, contain LysM domain [Modestobacter sp. DSM 44400]